MHAEMIPTGFETLMRLAQDRRLIRVKTVLEEETFVVKHFTGVEEVSAPYTFDIELLSAQAGLQLKQLIGQPLRLSLGDEFDGRVVHGYVREFAQVGKQGELSAYRCELAPWFAFLQYTSNCRIFQDLNVLDIIERVFDGYPQLADYAHDLDAARYPKLSYCVQYNESDFQFVSRLLEDAGIYYAFRHSDDAHTMVLSDDSTSSEQFGEPASIEFVSDQGTLQRPGVHRWAARRRVGPTAHALKSFDFKQPRTALAASNGREVPVGALPQLERYHYDGAARFADSRVGDALAGLRGEEAAWPTKLFEGKAIAADWSARDVSNWSGILISSDDPNKTGSSSW